MEVSEDSAFKVTTATEAKSIKAFWEFHQW
jgi:hypothetical protein